jgi:ubiquinol-cytochrome c reductase iron-sulfur subunit
VSERRAELVVALCFLTTMAAGGGLLLLYVLGGQTQLEGLLLTLAVGGIGVAFVVWSHELVPQDDVVEERTPLGGDPATVADVRAALLEESGIGRRKLLVGLMLGAFAGLGAAMLVPLLSLGPAPGRALHQTGWSAGKRLVGTDGQPVRAEGLPVGGVTTVFPDGEGLRSDSQTLLIRVEPELLQLAADRAAWAPDGYIAYSKLCTHAGCPVGLYLAETHTLVCPCHQSVFDVLRGAVPVDGPAARRLPQLPIQLQPDGTFVALADFPEPAGPSFWDMTHA